MNPDLSTNIAGIEMKNPVMTASGTFGWGREYAGLVDLKELGALVVKGLTIESRPGNEPPRIWETPAGMLNAIGLQNKGVDRFIGEDLPFLKEFEVPVIANVAGSNVGEYVAVCEQLNEAAGVAALELNVSCPNVEKGGLEFGTEPMAAAGLVGKVRQVVEKPLIVKLSPNVSDIGEIALAVEAAGADAVSLINTILGMAIDTRTYRPRLANIVGGLSGPAIRPVAVRMVWQVAKVVKIPIIGMGGIVSTEDAVEFFLAGARAVAIGTASFVNPKAVVEVAQGLGDYLRDKGLSGVGELVGKINVDSSRGPAP